MPTEPGEADVPEGPQEPRESVRLALVMNGGVSLAVWMGGATHEIHQLTQASRSLDATDDPNLTPVVPLIYRHLLKLTHSSATVDVISGTSAGGINGAALAVALLHDGDFSLLRDVWAKAGSLQTLLRPALGDNPGSLLQGDEYFLPEIRDALKRLVRRPLPRPALEQPIDLRLTTTLLTGHQGRRQDDLGTPLHDVDYRAHFLFHHLNDTQSCTRKSNWLDALALAARATASFPFAFEPAKVDADTAATYLRTPHGEALKPGDRHVLDGGLLDNKPFRGALEGIFNMPRRGPTRRVLAYVNPDPGDGPEGLTNQPMPPLRRVLGEALIAIPQSQTVSDQLAEIREHNDKVRRQRDSLLQVAGALSAEQLLEQAGLLYSVYRHRRLVNTYGLYIEPSLSQAVSSLGRRTLNQLKGDFCHPTQAYDWLPLAWTEDAALAVGGDTVWTWGLFPVEFGASVMLNMLKLAETLACLPSTKPAQGSGRSKRLHQLQALGKMWPDVTAIAARVKSRRLEEAEAWKAYRQALSDAWLDQAGPGDVTLPPGQQTPPRLQALRKAMFDGLGFLSKEERNRWCNQRMLEVATQLQTLAPLARWAAEHAKASPLAEQHRLVQAEGLLKLAVLFEGQSSQHIIHRLLQLEVVCYAFDDHETIDQDALIELVQISGNLRSPLSDPATAGKRSKLRGLELAHFSAFYKASWRAHDWTHGRLDGADRLVHTLLNPERLRTLYPRQAAFVAACVRAIALGASLDSVHRPVDGELAAYQPEDEVTPQPDEREALDKLWKQALSEQHITTELAYLDDPALPVPDVLAHCAAAIVRRLHLQVLKQELPHLIKAIAHDKYQGAEPGPNGAALEEIGRQARALNANDALYAMKQGLINDESLLEQAGTDLFTRTLAQVTAGLQNTLSSASAKLGPISWFFTLLKVPVQGFNLVAQGLTRQNGTAAALHGGMLAAGLLLVLVSGFLQKAPSLADKAAPSPSLPSSLVDAGWLMLIWGALFAMMRSPRVSFLVAGAALTGLMIGTLTGTFHVLPDWCLAWGAGGLLVLVGLVLAVVFYLPAVPWLQWAIGLMAIPAFASWSTHQPLWLGRRDLMPVEWCSLGLVAVVAVAMWQASAMGAKAERWARKQLKAKRPADEDATWPR
jgi:patatin-related protein